MDTEFYTKRQDFPEVLPESKTMFCKKCGATAVLKKKEGERTIYHCNACSTDSERYLVWDPGMQQDFNEAGELVHNSVGVIIQNQKGEILLFKRVKFPFLWTVPAGHLDSGEDPKVGAIRELKEETGIEVANLKQIFQGEIRGDSCAGGADIHEWSAYLFRTDYDLQPTIEADEGAEWSWFALDVLPEVTKPVEYLLAQESVIEELKDKG